MTSQRRFAVGDESTLAVAARVASFALLAALLQAASASARTPPPAAPPAASLRTPATLALVSSDSEGLEERRAPGAAGGWAVHLGGRFQSLTVGSVDANGRVRVRCIGSGETAPPAAANAAAPDAR